ncbi:unnamed protein product [Toxocara canis]|uniref:Plasma membrane fusion protein PRM1 n=1 Tax=Toxocara canis TaxID=6265 RepID=A0A183UNY3_TOXCA|nr:unnamed protein product [Toxocara canis]
MCLSLCSLILLSASTAVIITGMALYDQSLGNLREGAIRAEKNAHSISHDVINVLDDSLYDLSCRVELLSSELSEKTMLVVSGREAKNRSASVAQLISKARLDFEILNTHHQIDNVTMWFDKVYSLLMSVSQAERAVMKVDGVLKTIQANISQVLGSLNRSRDLVKVYIGKIQQRMRISKNTNCWGKFQMSAMRAVLLILCVVFVALSSVVLLFTIYLLKNPTASNEKFESMEGKFSPNSKPFYLRMIGCSTTAALVIAFGVCIVGVVIASDVIIACRENRSLVEAVNGEKVMNLKKFVDSFELRRYENETVAAFEKIMLDLWPNSQKTVEKLRNATVFLKDSVPAIEASVEEVKARLRNLRIEQPSSVGIPDLGHGLNETSAKVKWAANEIESLTTKAGRIKNFMERGTLLIKGTFNATITSVQSILESAEKELLRNSLKCDSLPRILENIGHVACTLMARPIHGIWAAMAIIVVSVWASVAAIVLIRITAEQTSKERPQQEEQVQQASVEGVSEKVSGFSEAFGL